MSDTTGPFESLAGHAHATHVVVVGGGIAGLVAAHECAKVGLRVTLIEAGELGGIIRSAEIAGMALDVGADGFSSAGGHVRALLEELHLSDDIEPEARVASWSGGAPLPSGSIIGIPANPWDPAVRRIIGWSGVWRAYLDRLRPPLTIGQEHNLDALVRRRMGDRVVDRLVAPLTYGRHGLSPAGVDVDAAAPGLNAALTRTGSLGGAVAQVRADRPAGGGNQTLVGGMTRLVDALRARLESLGAEVLIGSPVEAIARADETWEVVNGGETLRCDAVIVATPEGVARRLLAPNVTGIDDQPGAARTADVVTLVVDAAAVAASGGVTVYAVPTDDAPAAAVIDATARWPWLAERVGAHARVVRVLFQGREAPEPSAADGVAAASALLGVDLDDRHVLGARVDRWGAALPPSAIGHADAAAQARAAVHAVPGLAVVGAWLSGSGLAHVIPDAAAEAERVRRRALFGDAAAE
ncbi:FAD-dependent oxidoreductase [Planococcus sp. APC 4015]|nr:FAD-dependent oxidoreductase [Planococcus sp. APC 4015]